MLKSFSLSFPFFLLRLIVVIAEGIILFAGSIYLHDKFMEFMSQHVTGLFLTLLNPMGIIVGLGVSVAVINYLMVFIRYYVKLAHIIFISTLILDYNPYKGSRFVFSMVEAGRNFSSLALNDLTARTVVKSLVALKDTILEKDLMSFFKEPKTALMKMVKGLCERSFSNVMNVTDEIIVSYTWFTMNMYEKNLEDKNRKTPSLKVMTKKRAGFMLEGMVFLVRVLPKLLVSSLVYELGFFVLANVGVWVLLISIVMFTGISFVYLLIAVFLYRTLLGLFYYAFIDVIRNIVYINHFYTNLSTLEPLDIKGVLGSLVAQVPLLEPLIAQSGIKVEASATGGDHILDQSIQDVMKGNLEDVAKAFDLKTYEILDEQVMEDEFGLGVDSVLPEDEDGDDAEVKSEKEDSDEASPDDLEPEIETSKTGSAEQTVDLDDNLEVELDVEPVLEEPASATGFPTGPTTRVRRSAGVDIK